jgi:hypothetical protein
MLDPATSGPPRRSGFSPEGSNCVFKTVLVCLYPFYLPAADGDVAVACSSVALLIQDNRPSGPVETDLVGRMVGYGIAALDNLRLSMQPGLSDSKILQYRAGAVALGRSAEQCRKTLDALQAKRRLRNQAAAAHPMPAAPHPAPVAPLSPSAPQRPSAPPPETPPAQPQAAAPRDAGVSRGLSRYSAVSPPHASAIAVSPPASPSQAGASAPKPALPATAGPPEPGPRHPMPPDAASSHAASVVEGDPEFAIDVEVMQRNTHAMLADLQALAKQFGHDAPEAMLAQMALERAPPGQLRGAASA